MFSYLHPALDELSPQALSKPDWPQCQRAQAASQAPPPRLWPWGEVRLCLSRPRSVSHALSLTLCAFPALPPPLSLTNTSAHSEVDNSFLGLASSPESAHGRVQFVTHGPEDSVIDLARSVDLHREKCNGACMCVCMCTCMCMCMCVLWIMYYTRDIWYHVWDTYDIYVFVISLLCIDDDNEWCICIIVLEWCIIHVTYDTIYETHAIHMYYYIIIMYYTHDIWYYIWDICDTYVLLNHYNVSYTWHTVCDKRTRNNRMCSLTIECVLLL